MIPAKLVERERRRFGVPGVAIGVLHGDELDVAGFGVTSTRNPLEVDGDTLFQIGSISKTFAAAAVMRLVEMGRLDLDTPVRGYLPELRLADAAVAERVTMRNLLSHTGGWVGDYFESFGRGDDVLALILPRLERLPQLSGLGELFAYNNAGFYIVGRAIEVISEEVFESAMRRLVLDPLGLDRTLFFPDDVMVHRFAVGHDRSGAVAEPWPMPRPANVVGGLSSTVRDLFRYARSYWTPGDLLSADSLGEMRNPIRPIGEPPGYGYPLFGESVGLSWFAACLDGHRLITHSGGTNGQESRLLIAPEDRFALVVLTNGPDGLAVADEVQAEVLRSELGVSTPRTEPLVLSDAELSQYAGEYDSPIYRARIEVVDGTLVQTLFHNGAFPEPDSPPGPTAEPVRIEFEAKDAVIGIDPPRKGVRTDFVRGPSGEIEWYRYDGRLLWRSDR
jgi:CubicO group peptidase (beta-lactamase class C family)